ncbi:uncharacterized protein LOC125236622 isoform X2 [Leguminivora glycinivorella]|uniref:uncharacterized protein LOC125236622 isoform X2 n=1 Tax=Leguminivora glycinivorella TaxID=1035111 RepID=UPI0020105E58|nr:uncharacterized protein LOC125236622 isoform X2 [Leguminivora glycinivorella]
MAGSWVFGCVVLLAVLQLAICDQPLCEKNSTCPDNLACESSECVDPCLKHTKCGSQAHCVVEDHSAKCICNSGTSGNPYEKCYESGGGVGFVPRKPSGLLIAGAFLGGSSKK